MEKQLQAESKEASCHAFWAGSRLSPIARSCLGSFVKAGHRIQLHSYDTVADLPPGVENVDAGAIVPASQLFVHKETGSYSLFSNLFRYQILRRGLGLYVDCDVVCLRPIDTAGPYVFGWQDADVINGAVLKLPPDSPVLIDLVHLFRGRVFAPPWYPRLQRVKQYAKFWLNRPCDLAHAPWGSAGPTAITWYARRHDVSRHAQAPDVFYPLHWREVRRVLEPSVSWDGLITEHTRCVHLWNETLRHMDPEHAPRKSPLRELLDGHWP